MDFFAFIDNAAILLSLVLLSTSIKQRWFKSNRLKDISLGVLYGVFAIIAMSVPMELQPGLIFDGRSIILSLCGLFSGSITTLIACLIAASARIYIGGAGTFTGVGSVIISGAIGLIFRWIVDSKKIALNLWNLLLFGFVVHLVLVAWFFTLPKDIALLIVKNVALPYLIIFPLATMLIGVWMVDQQKRLEIRRDLAKSEKHYRDLVNTLNEGVWETDVNLITTFVNPKMADLLGYTPAEMIGQPVFRFIPEELHQMVKNHHKKRRQGIKEQYEIQIYKKDGSIITTQLGATPVLSEDGEFMGTLAGLQDITEIKKIQAELAAQSRRLEELVEERTRDLKTAQEDLIKVEKLATLGELAGSVGHELRNPLAVIANSIYLLKNSLPESGSNIKDYINMIEEETHNASRIINDLLDYSRIQPTVKEQTRLPDIISDMLGEIPHPNNIHISNNVADDIPSIIANPQQVRQILYNLFTNAIEAMPDGGELSLNAKVRKNTLSISISDTGVGISAKNIKQIFKPLFTTKPRGIGLGLAITAKLADLNNIQIKVKSKVGQGTTFTLTFLI